LESEISSHSSHVSQVEEDLKEAMLSHLKKAPFADLRNIFQ
jgi:hypothetical protein